MSLIKNQWQSAALLSSAADAVYFYARLCIISLSTALTLKEIYIYGDFAPIPFLILTATSFPLNQVKGADVKGAHA